jgi:hypothetical protein
MKPIDAMYTVMAKNKDRYDPMKAKTFKDLMAQQQFQMQQQLQPYKIAQFQQQLAGQELDNRKKRQEVYQEIYSQSGGGQTGIATAAKSMA